MHTIGLSRRHFLIAALFIPVMARADLYEDYVNSTSKKSFVAFLGRKGSSSTIGHAFVGVGVELNAGLHVFERFFGLYPKNGTLAGLKSSFGPQSGALDHTWSDLAWDTELRRFINDHQKTAVMAKFSEWSADAPKYSLIENGGVNCNGLVSAVATSIDLKLPNGAGSTRPWKFIELLKQLNP